MDNEFKNEFQNEFSKGQPSPTPSQFNTDDLFADRPRNKITLESKKPFQKFFSIAATILVIAAVGIVGFVLFHQSTSDSEEEVPTIKADQQDYKLPAPNEEADIPNMDKKVYEALENPENKTAPSNDSIINSQTEEPVSRQEIAKLENDVNKTIDNAQQIIGTESTSGFDTKITPPADSPEVKPITEPSAQTENEAVKTNVENTVISEISEEKKTEPTPVAKKEAPVQKAAVKKVEKKEVTKKETSTAAKTSRVSGRSIKVQLGAFKDDKEAKQAWSGITKTGLVGDLSAYIDRADLGAKGIFYRLQTGPFKSTTEAKSFCKKMAEHKKDCFVVAN